MTFPILSMFSAYAGQPGNATEQAYLANTDERRNQEAYLARNLPVLVTDALPGCRFLEADSFGTDLLHVYDSLGSNWRVSVASMDRGALVRKAAQKARAMGIDYRIRHAGLKDIAENSYDIVICGRSCYHHPLGDLMQDLQRAAKSYILIIVDSYHLDPSHSGNPRKSELFEMLEMLGPGIRTEMTHGQYLMGWLDDQRIFYTHETIRAKLDITSLASMGRAGKRMARFLLRRDDVDAEEFRSMQQAAMYMDDRLRQEGRRHIDTATNIIRIRTAEGHNLPEQQHLSEEDKKKAEETLEILLERLHDPVEQGLP